MPSAPRGGGARGLVWALEPDAFTLALAVPEDRTLPLPSEDRTLRPLRVIAAAEGGEANWVVEGGVTPERGAEAPDLRVLVRLFRFPTCKSVDMRTLGGRMYGPSD